MHYTQWKSAYSMMEAFKIILFASLVQSTCKWFDVMFVYHIIIVIQFKNSRPIMNLVHQTLPTMNMLIMITGSFATTKPSFPATNLTVVAVLQHGG